MIADVPIGAFLSGGIDSTIILTAMARISKEPVKTFTIGFTDDMYRDMGANIVGTPEEVIA